MLVGLKTVITYIFLAASLWLLNSFALRATTPEQSITLNVLKEPGNTSLHDTYKQLAKNFTAKYPSVRIKFIKLPHKSYRQTVDDYLKDTDKKVDIISWHAGERLFKYARVGALVPLDDIWSDNSKYFSQAIESQITLSGSVYGLPFSYYQWGIYYKQSLFKRLNIQPPTNWLSLLQVIKKLNSHNIIPIAIGAKQNWAAACWFEYINLRLNGYAFHSDFIKGKIAAYDPRIENVLKHWKSLIELNAFAKDAHNRSIRDSLPAIYKEKAGMTLEGSFIESYAPDHMKENIGFFEFPAIEKNILPTQVAPTDVFIIPKKSEAIDEAKIFINYLMQPEIQSRLNAHLYQLPANMKADIKNSNLLIANYQSLNKAKHLTQFYDRQAEEGLANENMDLWVSFLNKPDIKETTRKMEQARQNYLHRINLE